MARQWRMGARSGALGVAAIPGALATIAYVSGGVPLPARVWPEAARDDGASRWGTSIGADAEANVYLAGVVSGAAGVVGEGGAAGLSAGGAAGVSAVGAGAGVAGVAVGAGAVGVIVAKVDPEGARLWTRICAAGGAVGEPRIAVDAAGEAALAITFQGTIDCGGREGAVMAAGGGDDFDALVVKLDRDGRVLWQRSLGDIGAQAAAAVAFDPWGSVIVAGSFEGALALGGAQLVARSERDALLVKLDAGGEPVWGAQLGESGFNFGLDVAVAPSGRLLLLVRAQPSRDGDARGEAGGETEGEARVQAGGEARGEAEGEARGEAAPKSSVVAAFDPDGRRLWSRRLGGSGEVLAAGVRATAGNQVVVAGSFTGTADLGAGPLRSAGGRDVFVAKLDAAGSTLWSERFGDDAEQVALGLATGPGERIAIAGHFNGVIDFGNGPLTSHGAEVFVAALDTRGRSLWSLRGGEPLFPSGLGVAMTCRGQVLVTGAPLLSEGVGAGPLASERPRVPFAFR